MFENPRRGRQARNFTTNVPKILDLKSSSKQIFLEHWHWVPLITSTLSLKKNFAIFERIWYPFEWLGVSVQKKFSSIWTAWAICSEKIVVRLNSLFYPFQKKLSSAWTAWAVCWKNCHLLEWLGISVSKNCYPFGWLGLSIRKRNCRLLEELNLSVQR